MDPGVHWTNSVETREQDCSLNHDTYVCFCQRLFQRLIPLIFSVLFTFTVLDIPAFLSASFLRCSQFIYRVRVQSYVRYMLFSRYHVLLCTYSTNDSWKVAYDAFSSHHVLAEIGPFIECFVVLYFGLYSVHTLISKAAYSATHRGLIALLQLQQSQLQQFQPTYAVSRYISEKSQALQGIETGIGVTA